MGATAAQLIFGITVKLFIFNHIGKSVIYGFYALNIFLRAAKPIDIQKCTKQRQLIIALAV